MHRQIKENRATEGLLTWPFPISKVLVAMTGAGVGGLSDDGQTRSKVKMRGETKVEKLAGTSLRKGNEWQVFFRQGWAVFVSTGIHRGWHRVDVARRARGSSSLGWRLGTPDSSVCVLNLGTASND